MRVMLFVGFAMAFLKQIGLNLNTFLWQSHICLGKVNPTGSTTASGSGAKAKEHFKADAIFANSSLDTVMVLERLFQDSLRWQKRLTMVVGGRTSEEGFLI